MLYFMGLKTILTILKPVSPVQAHFNSLSVSAFVCIWADWQLSQLLPSLGYSISGSLGQLGRALRNF